MLCWPLSGHGDPGEQLKEMTERLVAAEMQLDKTTREKVSLLAELEAAKGELCSFDMDYNKVHTHGYNAW